jgi:cytoskeletal protein RodZ
VEDNQLETRSSKQLQEASLGKFLTAARERRGLAREAIGEETNIPDHYLRMLEDDDYRLISDQLYLLPFLRKYASFLGLDPEEASMRLVREVQRIENNPIPVRVDEPLMSATRNRRNWSKAVIFSALILVMIAAYVAQSRHNEADNGTAIVRSLPPAVPASQSSAVAKATRGLPSENRAFNPTASRSMIAVGSQSFADAGVERRELRQPPATQPMVLPVGDPKTAANRGASHYSHIP